MKLFNVQEEVFLLTTVKPRLISRVESGKKAANYKRKGNATRDV